MTQDEKVLKIRDIAIRRINYEFAARFDAPVLLRSLAERLFMEADVQSEDAIFVRSILIELSKGYITDDP